MLLEQTIQASTSLGTVVEVMQQLRWEHERYGNQGLFEPDRIINGEHLDSLEKLVLERIQLAARTGDLLQVRNLLHVLDLWSWIAGPRLEQKDTRSPKDWVQHIIRNNDENLAVFLARMLELPKAEQVANLTKARFDWEGLIQYLNVEEAFDQVQSISANLATSELQRAALQQFKDQYHRARLRANAQNT